MPGPIHDTPCLPSLRSVVLTRYLYIYDCKLPTYFQIDVHMLPGWMLYITWWYHICIILCSFHVQVAALYVHIKKISDFFLVSFPQQLQPWAPVICVNDKMKEDKIIFQFNINITYFFLSGTWEGFSLVNPNHKILEKILWKNGEERYLWWRQSHWISIKRAAWMLWLQNRGKNKKRDNKQQFGFPNMSSRCCYLLGR